MAEGKRGKEGNTQIWVTWVPEKHQSFVEKKADTSSKDEVG